MPKEKSSAIVHNQTSKGGVRKPTRISYLQSAFALNASRSRRKEQLMLKKSLRCKISKQKEKLSAATIKCEICKVRLASPSNQLRPVCRVCSVKQQSRNDDSQTDVKSEDALVLPNDNVRLKYPRNPESFASKEDARLHTRSRINQKSSQMKINDGLKFVNITDEVEMTALVCRYCEAPFVQSLAISHAASHCANDSFPCCFCRDGPEFSNDISLEKHLEDTHMISCFRGRDDSDEDVEEILNTVIVDLEYDRNNSNEENADDIVKVDTSIHRKDPDYEVEIKPDPMELAVTENDLLTEARKLESMEMTPHEDVILRQLLSEYDIEDIDPEILETLKANILLTIRSNSVKGEPEDAVDVVDVFECTDCLCQFTSYELVCEHKCPRKKRRGRPPKSRTTAVSSGDEAADSDEDPEWKLSPEDERRIDEDVDDIDDEEKPSLYFKGDIPEYAPRSVPCECEHCGAQFRSKVRLQFHMKYHKLPYSEADDLIYDCQHCPHLNFDTETELFDHLNYEHKAQRLLVCPFKLCKRTFNKRTYYHNHMRSHSGVRKFACTDCDKRFFDRQTLVEHSIIHMKVKPYQCHICFRYMTRRSRLRSHLKNHDSELVINAVYACKRCQMGFKDLQDAEEHAASSEGCSPDGEREACGDPLKPSLPTIDSDNCDTYKISAESDDHRLLVERAVKMFADVSRTARDAVKVSIVDKAIKCEYCGVVYLTFKALRRHREIHEGSKCPFICDICKATYPTYARVTSHKTTHGYYRRSSADIKLEESRYVSEGLEKPELSVPEQRNPDLRKGSKGYFPVIKHFLCNACDKTYLHWTYMQIHKRTRHSTTNNSKCNICNELFSNSWRVAYHKRKVHNVGNKSDSAESLTCKDCGKVTCSKSALHYHRRMAHATHTCQRCHMKFGTRAGLETHVINKHKDSDGFSSKGGYQCSECSNSYVYSAGLYTHMKRVHEKSLSHKCLICKQRYFSRYELESHVRSHTDERPFKCVHCGKGFRNTSLRNSHEKIHLNLRPYQCDKCESAFRRSNALKNHLLLHTGVKNFACNVCHKRFWNQSALKFHTKKKHSSEPAKEFLLLKVPGVNLTEDEIVSQLTVYNIPRSKIVDITEIGFKRGSALPKSLNLSDVSHLGAFSIVFKEGDDSMLISEKGKTIANVLKQPIIPLDTHNMKHAQTRNIVENGGSTPGDALGPISQEFIVNDANVGKEADTVEVADKNNDPGEEGNGNVVTLNTGLTVNQQDGMIVTADGKVIIQGEVFQLENADGQPLNLENAVITIDEHGQLVIEEPNSEATADDGAKTS